MGKKKGKKGKTKDPQAVANEWNEKLVTFLSSNKDRVTFFCLQIFAAMTNRPQQIRGNLEQRIVTIGLFMRANSRRYASRGILAYPQYRGCLSLK